VWRTDALGNLEGESGLPSAALLALPTVLCTARPRGATSNLEISPALKYALVANPGKR